MNFLRGIFLTSSNRSASSALVWLIALLVLAAVVHRDAFFSRPAWTTDGHAALSLHLAVADAYCGKKGRVSTRYDLSESIAKDRRLVRVALPAIIGEVAGSADAYCASVDREALNNENSLMLTMTWALKIHPQLSPGGLARVLGGLRLALVAALGYAILLSGGSVLFAALGLLMSADVLKDLTHYQYAVYPFLAPILLGLAGLYVILLRYSPASARLQLLLSAGLGMFTAFCGNIRSSHLPIYTLFFLVYAVLLARRQRVRSAARALFPALGCFVVGYVAFNWLLIRPLIPHGPHSNRAYHVVAHPLVLGLAVPPSDLSRREGIEWSDEVGIVLARRMIPHATYLGPDYERALFQYYRSLWRQYPGEMIGIYLSKLAMAGKGMLGEQIVETQFTARLLAMPGVRLNGLWLTLLYVGALVAAARSYRKYDNLLGLLFCFLSAAAIALMAESTMIFPMFSLSYHAYLLIFSGLLALMVFQAGVDAVSGYVQNRYFTESHRPASR